MTTASRSSSARPWLGAVSVLADRLRRAAMEDFDPRAAASAALQESRAADRGGARGAGRPTALRGISMIGGCAGHIPGSRPDRNHRLDRWSGR